MGSGAFGWLYCGEYFPEDTLTSTSHRIVRQANMDLVHPLGVAFQGATRHEYVNLDQEKVGGISLS